MGRQHCWAGSRRRLPRSGTGESSMKIGRRGPGSAAVCAAGRRVEVFKTPEAVEPLIETGLDPASRRGGASLRLGDTAVVDRVRGSSRWQGSPLTWTGVLSSAADRGPCRCAGVTNGWWDVGPRALPLGSCVPCTGSRPRQCCAASNCASGRWSKTRSAAKPLPCSASSTPHAPTPKSWPPKRARILTSTRTPRSSPACQDSDV